MSKRTFSFEFFPPKTPEGTVKLRDVRTRLAALNPDFFSVTFGTGGSTREGTWNTVLEIHQAGLAAAPHVSCVGSSRSSISKLLNGYREAGIRRLVTLRGDAPSGTGTGGGELTYANELVEFVRAESGDWFHIEVAAYPEYHPQSRSPAEDLAHFVRKVRAGASSAITQYFYNADAYYRFCDDAHAQGCTVPIVPGVMPITNFAQLARFSDACGAEIPRWIRNKLASFGDDRESIRAFGLDVVCDLCERLLAQGAPGLHLYTMNMADASLEIWRRLDLPK
ncbi:MAG TPA: methylenetetrahydrofolate reductase [NAD(P)H] [Burkholderiaceae bacterium]|nr:methylenetetrahydrofolate reductase [NAD(P)H] [Burkholderiaceae bacterium]